MITPKWGCLYLPLQSQGNTIDEGWKDCKMGRNAIQCSSIDMTMAITMHTAAVDSHIGPAHTDRHVKV